MASPLLTKDGKRYLWPPADIAQGLGIEPLEYERVTHVLNDGEPKHWMKPWVSKIIAEYVAENYVLLAGCFGHTFTLAELKSNEAEKIISTASLRTGAGIRFLKSLPDQLRDTAAVRGTDIHHYMERLSLGQKVVVPDHLLDHVDQGLEFLKLYKPRYLMTEQTVFNGEYGYAGSFDAIVEIPHSSASAWLWAYTSSGDPLVQPVLRVLIDYKTGDKGAKDSNALQLAMYRYAEFIGHKDGSTEPVPDVDLCAVLSINADKFELVPMRTDGDIWSVCQSVIGVAHWTQDLAKTAMPSAKERKANKLAESGGVLKPPSANATVVRTLDSAISAETGAREGAPMSGVSSATSSSEVAS